MRGFLKRFELKEKVVLVFFKEIERLEGVVKFVLEMIEFVRRLEFYEVLFVEVVDYNDWVYDLVILEIYNFIVLNGFVFYNI